MILLSSCPKCTLDSEPFLTFDFVAAGASGGYCPSQSGIECSPVDVFLLSGSHSFRCLEELELTSLLFGGDVVASLITGLSLSNSKRTLDSEAILTFGSFGAEVSSGPSLSKPSIERSCENAFLLV